MRELDKIIAKYIFVILLALTMLGGFLRFYKITENPISLSIDEVSFGYNAFSILKTGRDEYGKFFPLTFKSTGDYKNPVPIYLMVPSIALFGLNEFGIRFPTALIATLTIPIFFLLFMEISGSFKISLVATALLTISPWHIYYSRYVSDHLIAASLVVLGVLCFLRMLKTGRWFWSVGSAVFFVLSMYTYYVERLFVPLLLLLLFLLKRRELKAKFKQIILFLTVCIIIASPLIFSVFFGPDRARAQMTWLGNDVEFVRNVAVKPLSSIPFLDSDNLLLFYFGARKYLNYFDPGFLFYSGLNMTTVGSYGLGVLYLFEIPFLILGIITLFKTKIASRGLIIIWILIGLIPASLTNNEQHPGRTFVILPMLILISAIGAIEFFRLVKNHFNRYLRNIIFVSFLGLIVWDLIQAFLIFSVHFPRQRGENFMEGTKETVEYALMNKNMYKEIVFDPYRGIEAPYIVSIPHMYILFYSQYDPATYQKEEKIRSDGSFGFDNFTIRKIDWRLDRSKKDTLFIGSPWSLPEKDIKNDEILRKVYLSGGQPAFLIVSPK
ncbi:MAG: glycosyltransferase family 39 protein [Patescibacteria group bacterium]